ncbi:MAG TPA: ASKHA domain-containing protein [Anaerolineae bacterium]|nr:ASKHA domain-containing protein [Anaerolineae bacterium]
MTNCIVTFKPHDRKAEVPPGTVISEAAGQVGIELNMPCGGQGRCGRCAVIVEDGDVQRRSVARLSPEALDEGYALACQTVIESDLVVTVPPQDKIERRLPTSQRVAKIELPFLYDSARDQTIQKYFVTIEPPSLDDNTDDLARLRRALQAQHGIDVQGLQVGVPVLRKVAGVLREAEWQVTVVLETDTWVAPHGPPRLVNIVPGDDTASCWGVAVDIGTTSNVVYLVDLLRGEVVDTASEYNGQIARGEDVISRIIYASKGDGLAELQGLVVETINGLLRELAARNGASTNDVYKMTVAGNSTMIHLFLCLPPESIRLAPFVTTTNQPPPVMASEVGVQINPLATVDCLPGVGSYVGADITAGVLSSDMCSLEQVSLFIDIGTNGEIVLGDCDWLISCACSAGPAFEGAGMRDGMRATAGAIEEVWVDDDTFEASYRVIGDEQPRGICGSGLISLLAEMFVSGVMDKAGDLNTGLDSPRLREGDHGPEYVVAWSRETATGQDIAINKVDIDNLLRAKAAVYAGFSVLARSVGTDLGSVENILIAGAFGQYLDVENAIQIGLLPDLPRQKFKFLGNTSILGAYMALLSRERRKGISDVAQRMTYLELSADNTFHDEWISALFFPHTHIGEFPTVMDLLRQKNRS